MVYIFTNCILYLLTLVRSTKYILLLIPTIFTVIAGTRYTAGGDVEGYIHIFNNTKPLYYFLQGDFNYSHSLRYDLEWLYGLVNSVVKTFGFEYYVVFLLMSLTTNIYIIKSIIILQKHLRLNYIIFFIVYFNFCFFTSQMWYVRQGLASVFIFYSILNYLSEKRLKSYIYFILALGIHLSSSMALLPMLLVFLKLNYRQYIYILIASIFVYAFKIQILVNLIDFTTLFLSNDINLLLNYSKGVHSGARESLNLITYLNIFISLYILLIRKKTFEENIYYKLVAGYVIFSVVFTLLFHELQIMGRINVSLSIGFAFLLAAEYYQFKQKDMYTITIVGLSFLYFLRNIVISEFQYDLFFPYDNFVINNLF